uniref:Rep protein n=1 Tax=Escherichia coli TaxID=562 RepID=A0A3G4RXC2_ECOLX|nr:hypothetical protein D0362_00166 [Escherichia coli]
MCKCNTVTRDDIPFAIWSGLRPDTPHQCVRAQMWFPVLFRFLAHSLTNVRSLGLRSSGATSRMLSVIPLLFFRG